MKNHFLLLALFSLLFITCQDDDIDDDFPPNPFDNELRIDIATGLNARDINGNPAGTYGNPNTSFGLVEAYPNPAIDQISVQFIGQDRSVVNCWIFPATRDTTYADFDYTAFLDTYLDEEINAQADLLSFTPASASFQLDLSGLAPGYYRIFYDLDTGERYWDNLYVDPSASDPMILSNEVAGDW